MRCFSVVLFAAMSAVLPLAGVKRYFCTMNMEFVQSADDCPKEGKICCAKKEKPTQPGCMASEKSLPNADKHSPIHVPDADGVWEMLPVVLGECAAAHCVESVLPDKERGPPDRSRLFAGYGRLLI